MDQQSIRVDHIGAEGQPVVVVENFSPHPERLVAEAERLDFQTLGEFYPGVRAPVLPGYFEGLGAALTSIAREVFGGRDRLSFTRALYSLATTPPGDLTLAQRIPHIDGTEEGMVAIIHYLSPWDHGGTAFYRHRSTGFETVDAGRHRAYLDALGRDFAVHGEPAAAYIDGDTPIFERIAAYDGVFNRALIYRSSLLHSARLPNDAVLPRDVRAGRLTAASFLTVG